MGQRLEDLVDDDRITAIGLLMEAHAGVAEGLAGDLDAECSLPAPWYGVLVRLARSPEMRMRMSDLAAAVALTSSGATRLVDRIEAAGLIERQSCPTDRRVAYASLTDKGRALVARATPVHLRSIDRHLVSRLAPDELETLVALLRKLRDATVGAPVEPAAR